MLGEDLLKVFDRVHEEMGDNFDLKKFEEIIGKENASLRKPHDLSGM